MIFISDIHGCYKTLLALFERLPAGTTVGDLYFLGDLVDRGPRSKDVVQFAMDHQIKCVKGNHDDMMADYVLGTEKYLTHGNRDCWAQNGAMSTIESYKGEDGNETIAVHARFLQELPLFIELDDVLLTHTGNGRDGLNWFEQLWTRNILKPTCHRFRVHGHTQHAEVQFGENIANIDTGCAYPKYGNLTAMVWPSREIITQPCIDYDGDY